MNKMTFKLFMIFIFFIKILPQFMRDSIFKNLAKILYIIGKKSNKVIETNLRFVFKDISKEEITEIQKYSYSNMLSWGQSIIENLDVKDEEFLKNIELENIEVFHKLKAQNKRIIFISAHYGNMEIMSYYVNKFVTPLVQVARASKNKEFDNFLVKSREKSGSKIVFRAGALKHLVRALKNNKVISLVIDQNVNPINAINVKLFAKDVYQSSSTAILARKFDAYIIPAAAINLGNKKYKIKFYEAISPIKTENEKDDLFQSSQLQANALEKIILEDKKQWFWLHKRFKGFYDEIYK